MVGYEVNKGILDTRSGQAVVDLREAYDKIEAISKFLANHPNDGVTEPLVDDFGYTTDEAYALRIVFEGFETSRVNLAPTFDTARKISGLE